LRAPERILYNMAVLTCKALHGGSPRYRSSLVDQHSALVDRTICGFRCSNCQPSAVEHFRLHQSHQAIRCRQQLKHTLFWLSFPNIIIVTLLNCNTNSGPSSGIAASVTVNNYWLIDWLIDWLTVYVIYECVSTCVCDVEFLCCVAPRNDWILSFDGRACLTGDMFNKLSVNSSFCSSLTQVYLACCVYLFCLNVFCCLCQWVCDVVLVDQCCGRCCFWPLSMSSSASWEWLPCQLWFLVCCCRHLQTASDSVIQLPRLLR